MNLLNLNQINGKQGVYRIVNKLTGQSYIGSSSDIGRRLNNHFAITSPITSSPLYFDIYNYDWSIFKIEILLIVEAKTKEELETLEFNYITKYDTLYPNGYNLYAGKKNVSDYKKWLSIDIQKFKIQNSDYKSKHNLFYTNLKHESCIVLPFFAIDYFEKRKLLNPLSIDYFINYYDCSNLIRLTHSLSDEIVCAKVLKLKGIKAKKIIEDSSSSIDSASLRLEKHIFNNQIEYENTTYVNLGSKYNFKDNNSVMDFDLFFDKLKYYYFKTTDPIVRELYFLNRIKPIKKFYNKVDKKRFKYDLFKRQKLHYLIISYPYIGMMRNNIRIKIQSPYVAKINKKAKNDRDKVTFKLHKISNDSILIMADNCKKAINYKNNLVDNLNELLDESFDEFYMGTEHMIGVAKTTIN